MVDQTAAEMPTEDDNPSGQRQSLSYCVRHRDGRVSPFTDHRVLEFVRQVFHPGAVINNRYVLRHEIGLGGMGLVFLGEDSQLDRSVAIKVIAFAQGEDGVNDRELSRRAAMFAQEAKLGANLLHPAIAAVFDYGLFQERPYTVFEYVSGETLADSLRSQGSFTPDDTRIAVSELAKALDFAHGKGVIHRDLKPSNVKVFDRHQYKLLDLGLAKRFHQQEEWSFAGTPAYASPEQCGHQHCDGRADQYALACIAFELLTGRLVFEGRGSMELLRQHRFESPPLVSKWLPDAPEELCQAVDRALSKDPNDRFLTCQDFAAALGARFVSQSRAASKAICNGVIWTGGLHARTPGWWRNLVVFFTQGAVLHHVALTADAVCTTEHGAVQLHPLGCLQNMKANEDYRSLTFSFRTSAGKESVELHFRSAQDFDRWRDEFHRLDQQDNKHVSANSDEARELEVPLLKRRPDQQYQILGSIEAVDDYRKTAHSALRLEGALMGADAIVETQDERIPGTDKHRLRSSGIAVKAIDEAGRAELDSRLFVTVLNRFVVQLLAPLAICTVYVYLINPTASRSLHLALLSIPWVAIACWRFSLWPQLLRPTLCACIALALDALLFSFSLAVGLVMVIHAHGFEYALVAMSRAESFRPVHLFVLLAAFAAGAILGLCIIYSGQQSRLTRSMSYLSSRPTSRLRQFVEVALTVLVVIVGATVLISDAAFAFNNPLATWDQFIHRVDQLEVFMKGIRRFVEHQPAGQVVSSLTGCGHDVRPPFAIFATD